MGLKWFRSLKDYSLNGLVSNGQFVVASLPHAITTFLKFMCEYTICGYKEAFYCLQISSNPWKVAKTCYSQLIVAFKIQIYIV